jgi:hypothetical protein
MANCIYLDQEFLDTLKSIKELKLKIKKLENKNDSIIRQIFKKALPSVISAHKWAIAAQPDEDPDDNFFSLSLDIIYPITPAPYRAGSQYKNKRVALPRVAAAQASRVSVIRNKQKSAKNTSKKCCVAYPRIIKDIQSLSYFSEKYNVYAISYNKCNIQIYYNRLMFSSNNSIDDVFSAIKSLKFPLDLARYLKDIEISEEILLKKKKLLKDIAPTILFSM